MGRVTLSFPALTWERWRLAGAFLDATRRRDASAPRFACIYRRCCKEVNNAIIAARVVVWPNSICYFDFSKSCVLNWLARFILQGVRNEQVQLGQKDKEDS